MRYIIPCLLLISLTALSLQGCSGGTAIDTVPFAGVASKTISGTASEGALITGKTVKLKDANGKSAVDVTTNATTGSYSVDVTDLTAPFLLTVTGTDGTYVSLAQSTGTANINPITSMVVALAAGTADVSGLFLNLTPSQLAAIKTNHAAKCDLVTASLQAALPTGIKASDYFTGTITAGIGMDAVFDTYQIVINPTSGITIKTKGANVTIVLTIPDITVTANTTLPLPVIAVPTAQSTYSLNDLQGTWYRLKIENGGGGLWEFSKIVFDTAGNGTYSQNSDSEGSTFGTMNLQFSITSTGTVTTSKTTQLSPTTTSTYILSGVMSQDKNLIVATVTPDTSVTPNTVGMEIFVKGGASYAQGDLQGTWMTQSLIYKGTSTYTSYDTYQREEVSIDSLGAMTMANKSPVNFAISTQGLVTAPGTSQANLRSRGILSADKNLMVFLSANNDGSVSIAFYVRTGGTTFSLEDLRGTWRGNALSIQNSTWHRDVTTIESTGNFVISTTSASNNISHAYLYGSFPLMSSGGKFSASGGWSPTFSGVMALNKNLMIATMTQDPENIQNPFYVLSVWLK